MKEQRKTYLGFTLVQIAGLIGAFCIWVSMAYVFPAPAGLSSPGWAATAIMLMMIVIWITDALPSGVCAFLIVILLTLTGATDWGQKLTPNSKILNALTGFSAKETWLIAAAFILGMGVIESGLGQRITYRIMSLSIFATSFKKLILGFCFVQWIMAPFVPSSTAKAGIFIPLAQGILSTLGIKPYAETGNRSNNASALIIHTAWMTNSVGSMFATGTAGIVTGLGLLSSVGKVSVPWIDYFLAMMPLTVCVVIGSWYCMVKLFPPEIDKLPGGVQEAKARYAALGPLTSLEKRTAVIFFVTLLMWIFEKQIGIDSTTTAMIACFLLLTPVIGIGIKDKIALKRIGWDAVLLLAAGLSLSTALTKTGAAVWLAKAIFGGIGMETWHPAGVLAFFTAFVFLTHLGFAGNTAHKLAILPLVISSAMSMGLNPVWIGLPAIVSSTHSFILHTMSPPNVIGFGTGYFPLNDMIKSGIVVTIMSWIVIVVFAMVWFPLIGIPIYK
jgi:anion transporter